MNADFDTEGVGRLESRALNSPQAHEVNWRIQCDVIDASESPMLLPMAEHQGGMHEAGTEKRTTRRVRSERRHMWRPSGPKGSPRCTGNATDW